MNLYLQHKPLNFRKEKLLLLVLSMIKLITIYLFLRVIFLQCSS